MAKATVAGKVHKTLDVHRHCTAKIAFYGMIRIDGFADLQYFGIRKVLHTTAMINSQLVRDFDGLGAADTVNVGKRLLVGMFTPAIRATYSNSCSTGAPKDEPYLNADDIPKRTKPADALKRCWAVPDVRN
jgi:hypothetical protein